ncbi:hypothetical protein SALBM311S_05037 [Streptomyces alboniger]
MTTIHHTPDLFALSDIHGPILRPGDDAYAEEVTGFNLAALHTPDVVVGATGTDDIVTAMRWASATHTPVAVQATGHGANFPIDSGLLITTTRMTDVDIDPTARTATAAAGAKWRHVLDAAAPHGLAALTGTSSDAGVVGYTLGGGLPVLGRAYGYAADLVRSFQVVDPRAAHAEPRLTAHRPRLSPADRPPGRAAPWPASASGRWSPGSRSRSAAEWSYRRP